MTIDRLLQTIGGGSKVYSEAKQKLDLAISHYDQALFDLTASVVASTSLLGIADN